MWRDGTKYQASKAAQPGDQPPARPQGQAVTVAVARELLAAGAAWKGPAHMRTEVLPET